MKKTINKLLILSSILTLPCYAEINLGFEKESPFYKYASQTMSKNAVLNVYLDNNTDISDEYRLVINGEDTELNLFYNVVTRFGVNKTTANLKLLKNNQDVMSISLDLEEGKNYYLTIKETKGSETPIFAEITRDMIGNEIKQTPLYTSDLEDNKDEEIKKDKEDKELDLQKKKVGIVNEADFVQDEIKIELDKRESQQKEKADAVVADQVSEKKNKAIADKKMEKSIEEKYNNGESVFYYDPNDGE